MSKTNSVGVLFAVLFLLACVSTAFSQNNRVAAVKSEKISVYALRLTPGQDLRLELERFAAENKIEAAYIVTAVGSLTAAKIRLADKSDAAAFEGKFEIVSLVGTLSQNGSHLHLSIADGAGKTIGGHLVEGCKIYTTAEIIVGVSSDLIFTREIDSQTTFKELKVTKAGKSRRRKR